MDFLELALVFIFGTLIGSFLNVVIYRYNSGTSPLAGRSLCFSCGKTLHWYELIPLVSFIAQRGRCTDCGVRLSWQYPIVEFLSGLVFVSVFLLDKPLAESIYLLIIFSTLLVTAVYDLRHQIIPDGMVLVFSLLSLVWFVSSIGFPRAFDMPYLWTVVAGPMLFAPFWFLWWFSEGKWIGLGDGKLALGIGWFLGATLGGSAILLAFWLGAIWALALMGSQRLLARWAPQYIGLNLTMQSEIPFGPFLILAVFIVYFTGINFFDGSITLFNFFS